MTAPTFVAAGTFASGTGAITPGLPAGLADDDLLIAIFETANQAITLSGWTELASSPQGTGTAAAIGAVSLTAFYKFYTTGDTAPTSSDSGNHQAGRIFAFRGVDTTTPIEDTAGSTVAASNIQALPTVTSTSADALVLYLVANDRDIATTNTQFRSDQWLSPNADAAGTEIADDFSTSGVGGGIGAAYSVVTTPVTLSGATLQLAGSNAFASGIISVVLKPVSAGGSSEADIGLADETNTALALSKTERRDVALSTEAETSLALNRSQQRALGLSTETETVFALAGSNGPVGVGLSTETDTVFALVGSQRKAVGLCTEAETSLALGRAQSRALSLSSEAENSLALNKSQRRDLGLSTHVNTSLALNRAYSRSVGISQEINIVPSAGAQVLPVGLCVETSSALSLARFARRSTGISTQLDTSFALGKQQRKAISISIGSELALAASRAYQSPIGRSDELAQAFGLNPALAAPVGLCTETSEAFSLTRFSQRGIGLSVETDTAIARGFGSISQLPATKIVIGISKEQHTLFLNTEHFVLTQNKERIQLSLGDI